MQPGPGSLVPRTVEMKLAVSIPWAMRDLKNVPEAYSSSMWTGL
jgi:hypothetical protein